METREVKKIIKLIKKLVKKFIRLNEVIYSSDHPLKNISYINSQKKFIFHNISLFGGSRFIVLNNKPFFLSENFNNPKFIDKYLTDEEVNEHIRVKNNSISLIFSSYCSEEVAGNTISLMHPCVNNIYHFFFEACFDLLEAHRLNVPFDNLVIDRGLNSKYYLFIIGLIKVLYPRKKINFFKIAKNEKTIVKNLISFPNKNFQIHWLRNQKIKPAHYWNKIWLIHAQKIFSNLYKKPSKSKKILFLTRNSSVRYTINERSIIDFLKKSYIITTFDPVKKSLRSAFYHINKYNIIVGQVSAALTNILFAKEKKKFISWKYMGSNNNSLIWSDLFSILGHTLIELDAEPILSREIRLHWQELHISQSNLYIHPNIIFCALNEKK